MQGAWWGGKGDLVEGQSPPHLEGKRMDVDLCSRKKKTRLERWTTIFFNLIMDIREDFLEEVTLPLNRKGLRSQ